MVVASISNTLHDVLLQHGFAIISNVKEYESVHAIVTSNKLVLDAVELSKYKNLKWIARLGSGMEIIDTNYCDTHNIKYYSSPNGIANSVAEHIVGMLISLQKNIIKSSNEIDNNIWNREPNRGYELYNKTLGIIGYGHTGAATAQKLAPFCQKIIAYDKYKKNFASDVVQEVTLQHLQQHADIISLHLPLTEETKHFYNNDFIKICKDHVLINTSRGEIVHTVHMIESLKSNKIQACLLDVLEHEKELAEGNKYAWKIINELKQYNVLITPHIAGYSYNAIEKMCDELSKQIFST